MAELPPTYVSDVQSISCSLERLEAGQGRLEALLIKLNSALQEPVLVEEEKPTAVAAGWSRAFQIEEASSEQQNSEKVIEDLQTLGNGEVQATGKSAHLSVSWADGKAEELEEQIAISKSSKSLPQAEKLGELEGVAETPIQEDDAATTTPGGTRDSHSFNSIDVDKAEKEETERQRHLFKAHAATQGWLKSPPEPPQEMVTTLSMDEDDVPVPKQTSSFLQWMGRHIESGVFDMFFGAFILVNCLVMLLKLEHKGQQIGYEYGLYNAEKEEWPHVYTAWDVLDYFFTILFGLELVLRFLVLGKRFFCIVWNLFDFALVVMAIVEHLVGNMAVGFMLFRCLRLLRLARVLRIVRVMRSFRPLRILVQTTLSSFFALFWSVVLVGLIMVMSAIFIGQVLQPTMEDPDTSEEARAAIWETFGTAGHACYTLFKWTLTGTWAKSADPLIKLVDSQIAIFVVIYIVAVNFALTRVVGAVFIKDTWAAAQRDTEMVIEESLRKDGAIVRQLKALFEQFDTDENGALDKKEFTKALQDPRLKQWLRCLELDVHEASSLFVLMDNGSGTLTCDELIAGAMTLRGDAKAVDLASLMYENQRTRSILRSISKQVNMTAKLLKLNQSSHSTRQEVDDKRIRASI